MRWCVLKLINLCSPSSSYRHRNWSKGMLNAGTDWSVGRFHTKSHNLQALGTGRYFVFSIAGWDATLKTFWRDDLFSVSASVCLSWNISLDQSDSHCWLNFPNFRNLDYEQLTLNCNILGGNFSSLVSLYVFSSIMEAYLIKPQATSIIQCLSNVSGKKSLYSLITYPLTK